jgi:hypothetical protein
MKASLRALSLIPCIAALLAVPATAHATTYSISGEVWEGGTTGSVPVLGSSIYGTSPTAIFTVTNSSATSLLDFYSGNDASLTGFLTTNPSNTSNGDTLTYLSGASHGTDSVNNDLFEFQGTTTLADGSYNFEHDDGLLLYLTGNSVTNDEVINAGGPTAAVATAFTVCASGCDATAGTYTFTLLYAEVDGAPAELLTSLPLTGPAPVPEPSSFVLLGSGLLAAAGAVRRRLR